MDQVESQEFLAPDNGGWHRTVMQDWIAVCPDVSATAARLYWIVRSVLGARGERKRRLSVEQLCWLLPGISGQPTSELRVRIALRELESIGLLTSPDGGVVCRSVTDPGTGELISERCHRWQVHDFPEEGYQGPKSAIALLDGYPGHGGRKKAGHTHDMHGGPKSGEHDEESESTGLDDAMPRKPARNSSRESAAGTRDSVTGNAEDHGGEGGCAQVQEDVPSVRWPTRQAQRTPLLMAGMRAAGQPVREVQDWSDEECAPAGALTGRAETPAELELISNISSLPPKCTGPDSCSDNRLRFSETDAQWVRCPGCHPLTTTHQPPPTLPATGSS